MWRMLLSCLYFHQCLLPLQSENCPIAEEIYNFSFSTQLHESKISFFSISVSWSGNNYKSTRNSLAMECCHLAFDICFNFNIENIEFCGYIICFNVKFNITTNKYISDKNSILSPKQELGDIKDLLGWTTHLLSRD